MKSFDRLDITLTCPACHGQLTATGPASLNCRDCNRLIRIDNGVVRFLNHNDAFYEGTYEGQIRFIPRSERFWHTWPLWLAASGYPWTVRRHVPAGSTVLELGCAGGVRYFGSRYRMIGCDLSAASLRGLAEGYALRLQADAACNLPLLDNSLDAVVSSYFWEHIPPEVKPRILAEINRVLRPGGTVVFLYDVETRNPVINRYRKRDAARYRQLFIDNDDHQGYQSPGENLSLFQAAGFTVVSHIGQEKTGILSPSALIKLAQFGNGWASLGRLALKLQQPPLLYLYLLFMRLFDTVTGRLLPRDWARIDITVLTK